MSPDETNRLTQAVIGAAMRVSSRLGVGFLEKVYERALAIELRKLGLRVEVQKAVTVWYEDEVVGDYVVDSLVEDHLVLELKATLRIEDHDVVQTVNYLRASRKTIGLILCFGKPELQVKRLVHQHPDT